jgi:YggT family protein
MQPVIALLIGAIEIYIWIIVLAVVISWMVALDVLNARNKWVYKFCTLINAVTNPVIMKIRKVVPPVAGMDFSPVIAIFGLMIVQAVLRGMM